MAIQHIDDNPTFKAVTEPFRKIPREMGEVDQRLQAIHYELSALATNAPSDAWNIYINENQNGGTDQRAALRTEAEKLASRKSLLEAALQCGRAEVETVRARLSREQIKEARPRYVERIKRVLALQDEIVSVVNEMRRIREEIEDAGYNTGSLPPGDCNTDFEGHRNYLKANFPELGL